MQTETPPPRRRSPADRLVLIVFRNSLETDVLSVLRRSGVGAFTVLPQVLGVGVAGKALRTFPWPGSNMMILAVLARAQATALVRGLASFCGGASARQKGAEIPLRVFVVPCTQAV
ncbi:MAG TPA: hypothetical protein VKW76_05035 [Candidatus Binatia bacterium]|nr:hypothetical protein [Candidatus Binatia bacterium]